MLDHATTGDGLLTAIHLLAEIAEGRTLADLAAQMQRLPQVLINVDGVDRAGVDDNVAVQTAVEDAEADLGDSGRVLLRPSGTEPVVRVMVEAMTKAEAETVARRLADVVRTELAL